MFYYSRNLKERLLLLQGRIFGNRTESQRRQSKWKKVRKLFKKSQKERKSENPIVYCKYIYWKKRHDFFQFLSLEDFISREIKSEFSVCVHYTNFFHWLSIPWLFIPWLFYQRHYFLVPCWQPQYDLRKKSQGKKIILTLLP